MAYIASKEFRAEGRLIHQGEIIDAETWKTKGSLVSLGWISYIPEQTPGKAQDNDTETNAEQTPGKAQDNDTETNAEQTQKKQTNKTKKP